MSSISFECWYFFSYMHMHVTVLQAATIKLILVVTFIKAICHL